MTEANHNQGYGSMGSQGVDPYKNQLIKGNPFDRAKKRMLKGLIVAVTDVKFDNRGYQLIPQLSRAILSGEIHELITTAENKAKPGGEVNSVGVIGFVEFTVGGIVAVGDKVTIRDRNVGLIAGFDETHFPNHINIIIKAAKRVSGFDLDLDVENEVIIAR